MIAVVDDDDSVREAVAGLVKSMGYGAEAFKSADAFLNWKRRDGTDCLIADVQMPGMTGPELHDRLVASGNPIPTILITAYPDDATRARTLKAGVKGYLAKPFTEDELLDCLQSVLDGRAAGEPEA
jgi:FixJ family two-component response regulator